MTLDSQQYANLSDHSYGRDQRGNTDVDLGALVGKTVTMEDGVKYVVLAHVDKPSGYQGTIYQRESTGEIVVAHRGTEFGREPLKDGLLTDGGMVIARTNKQAQDAIELTQDALNRAKDLGKYSGGHAPEVTVTGHSLGGTLAQITAHHFDLRGETFNPYGAASLNYQIPNDPTAKVINHVMAADVVSSASPHYGEVRVYAQPSEISHLHMAGYRNGVIADALTPDHPVLGSVNTSHMMHNFLNINGDYKQDVSVLGDPAARSRASENAHMIEGYRSDVRAIRTVASLGGDVADVMRGGVLNPARAYEHINRAVQEPLPAGEPARREALHGHAATESTPGNRPAAPTWSEQMRQMHAAPEASQRPQEWRVPMRVPNGDDAQSAKIPTGASLKHDPAAFLDSMLSAAKSDDRAAFRQMTQELAAAPAGRALRNEAIETVNQQEHQTMQHAMQAQRQQTEMQQESMRMGGRSL